ncbi:glycosyltransferase [Aeromonas caviae]|uniref:glycosyltransferase n=1 Tax=Aeromonas caviae TaxID=648 RepID=UPI002B492B23|nr:glycosyltransferase [Aeromonas caviae]
MSSNKKILIVIPKLSNGGIERVASNFSMNLAEDGYRQVIYSIMEQDISYPFKVKPIILSGELGSGFFGKGMVFIKRLLMLRSLVKENEISIVISFGERCNFLTMLASLKCKKILTIHSQISIENKAKGIYGYLSDFAARYLYKSADRIIAVSNVVANDLRLNYHIPLSKIKTIYNGHDIDMITKKSSQVDISIKKNEMIYDFISVGRITYAKGHWHLIKAMSIVKKKYNNAKLIIIGGEEEGISSELITLSQKLGVEENIIFYGYSDNPYKYMSSARVFVLSSIFEGFPGVVVEALACGIPIVSSNSGGGTEVLLNGLLPSDLDDNKTYESEYGFVTPKLANKKDFSEEIDDATKMLAEAMIKCLEKEYDSSELVKKACEYSTISMVKNYELEISRL